MASSMENSDSGKRSIKNTLSSGTLEANSASCFFSSKIVLFFLESQYWQWIPCYLHLYNLNVAILLSVTVFKSYHSKINFNCSSVDLYMHAMELETRFSTKQKGLPINKHHLLGSNWSISLLIIRTPILWMLGECGCWYI